MNPQKNSRISLKGVYRVLLAFVVSMVAAEVPFIIFGSFAFLAGTSASTLLGGALVAVGVIAGLLAGIISFMKLNRYLKGEMDNV